MEKQFAVGMDIGGTKCAVNVAEVVGDKVDLLGKVKMETDLSISPEAMIDRLLEAATALVDGRRIDRIGISCGGPLDSHRGVILGPPNLPGWDRVEIVRRVEAALGAPAVLQNDANACAVAEWKFGAGKGTRNMIFLTFGTGLGAGLILDGRLFAGTNDNAGEVGHLRLEPFGPVGYGKEGSFEGFCSGNGIRQMGYTKAIEAEQQGCCPAYFHKGMRPDEVTAKAIAEAADAGDPTAMAVYRTCGEQLGRGLSVLIDILNPERIVIGSIFARSRHLLWPYAEEVIRREALPVACACCEVVPAALGEQIGDYAAIATALLKKEDV